MTPSSMPRPVMNRMLVVLVAIIVLAVVYLVAYDQGQRSGAVLTDAGGKMISTKDAATRMAVEQELSELGYEKQTTMSGTVVSSSDSSFVMEVPVNGSLERFTVRVSEGVSLTRTSQKDQATIDAEFAAFQSQQAAYDARVTALLDAFDPEDPDALPPDLPEPPLPPDAFISETLQVADLAAGDHVSVVVAGDATGMSSVTAMRIELLVDVVTEEPQIPPALPEGEDTAPAFEETPFGYFSVNIIDAPSTSEEPPLPPEEPPLPPEEPVEPAS